MKQTDYAPLLKMLSEAYARHAPRSAALQERAESTLIDGGSHAVRLIQPFPPRIKRSQGAWIEDEDGNRLLDFWQGHFANILGHNPAPVTQALAQAFSNGWGLQSGFVDRLQVELAELLCAQTGHERIRFTTSGSLATMYATMLSRAATGRSLVLKMGGGWHGSQPWGLKGVHWDNGFDQLESLGLPPSSDTDVITTSFNDLDQLQQHFREQGDQLACLIIEPVIGTGGMIPAASEFLQTARQLSEHHGAVLICDEVITGFRYRAGDVAQLYGVKPDLTTMGKIIGGGMPLAAVAGRTDILDQVGRVGGHGVAFSGGTYCAHPASLLAAKTLVTHLIARETEIYSQLGETGDDIRAIVKEAFSGEGIHVRFSGDQIQDLPAGSLHGLVIPRKQGLALNSPDEVSNPSLCHTLLADRIIQLAFLLEDIHVMHGIGCNTTAHGESEVQYLGEACQRVARLLKPYVS